jgi:phosphoglycolate phosphatase-like HAD superfamily hydrolase
VQPEDFREFVGTGDERYVEGVAEKYGVEIDTEAAVERRRENFFKLQEREPLPAMPGVLAICADRARLRGCEAGDRDLRATRTSSSR